MLRVHFLNVGQGDCTIIEHASGRLTMLDVNNATELDVTSLKELEDSYRLTDVARSLVEEAYWRPDELAQRRRVTKAAAIKAAEIAGTQDLVTKGYDIKLTNPVQFLKQTYPGRAIHRYIQSHPDLDHMRGLSALQSEGVEFVNFWDTEHSKTPDFQSDADRQDWKVYQTLTSSADNPKVLQLLRGSVGSFYNQDEQNDGGDGIEILSPTPAIIKAANDSGKTNNLSYVLRLTYKGVSVILPGDAEAEVWDDLVATYGSKLKCAVLKASHHGRDSGYHQAAVQAMNPEFTIVSVGKKPDQDASNKYRNYTSKEVWSTRWRGNITLTINDNGTASISSQYDR